MIHFIILFLDDKKYVFSLTKLWYVPPKNNFYLPDSCWNYSENQYSGKLYKVLKAVSVQYM